MSRTRKYTSLESILANSEEDEKGCFIWKGTKSKSGYGQLTWNGATKRTHRVVKELVIGRKLTESECAMHTCDVRLCCNPSHLVIGTTQDNTADMVRKGRHARWERHHGSKLTSEAVNDIRTQYSSGKKLKEIADAFNISETTVSSIVRAKSWRSLPGNYSPEHVGRRLGEDHKMAKLTEENVSEIRRLASEGLSTYKIAKRFSIHQSQAWRIVSCQSWTHLPGTTSYVRHTGAHKGETHYGTKLTEKYVREILNLVCAGTSQREIAHQFKVSQSRISAIASGKSWKHLTMQ